jgi:hypothetical protein
MWWKGEKEKRWNPALDISTRKLRDVIPDVIPNKRRFGERRYKNAMYRRSPKRRLLKRIGVQTRIMGG